MRKKRLIVLLVMALSAMFLLSCSGERYEDGETRTKLTLGILNLPNAGTSYADPGQTALEQAVLRFNQDNEDYYIEIDYYGEYGDKDALLAVNSALSSKSNIPDLLLLSGLPYASYMQRGLLCDLYTFFDRDGSFTREDFFSGPLEACEWDDKLCFLSPEFQLYVYGGTPESLGTDTFADTEQLFRAWQNKRDEGYSFFLGCSAMHVLSAYRLGIVDRFVNEPAKSCDFLSGEFTHALELLDSLPRDNVRSALSENFPRAIPSVYVVEGESVFCESSLSNPRGYAELVTQFGGDFVPAEVPFSDGKRAVCVFKAPVGIPALAANPEGAWTFLKYFLNGKVSTSAMLTGKMEEDLKEAGYSDIWEAQKLGIEVDEEKLCVKIRDPYDQTSGHIQGLPFTEALYIEYKALLEQPMLPCLSIWAFSDITDLQQIILSEVELFLNGKATAEQTAQTIQTRVELYLAEQS